MDIREMAVWLTERATDEEFAEFFVLYYKIFKTGNLDVELTKEDMANADIDEIVRYAIKNPIEEILFSEEVDASAWWKHLDPTGELTEALRPKKGIKYGTVEKER